MVRLYGRELIIRRWEDLVASKLVGKYDGGRGLRDVVAEAVEILRVLLVVIHDCEFLLHSLDLYFEDVPLLQGSWPVRRDHLNEVLSQILDAVFVGEADDAADDEWGVGVKPFKGHLAARL